MINGKKFGLAVVLGTIGGLMIAKALAIGMGAFYQ